MSELGNTVKETIDSMEPMASQISDSAVDVVKLTFSSLSEMVQVAVNDYGTQAADIALLYLQMDAFLGSLFPMVLGVFGVWFAIKVITHGLPEEHKLTDGTIGMLGYKPGVLFCDARSINATISIVSFIVSVLCIIKGLMSPWQWIGIFYPELYAIHLAMDVVTK